MVFLIFFRIFPTKLSTNPWQHFRAWSSLLNFLFVVVSFFCSRSFMHTASHFIVLTFWSFLEFTVSLFSHVTANSWKGAEPLQPSFPHMLLKVVHLLGVSASMARCCLLFLMNWEEVADLTLAFVVNTNTWVGYCNVEIYSICLYRKVFYNLKSWLVSFQHNCFFNLWALSARTLCSFKQQKSLLTWKLG